MTAYEIGAALRRAAQKRQSTGEALSLPEVFTYLREYEAINPRMVATLKLQAQLAFGESNPEVLRLMLGAIVSAAFDSILGLYPDSGAVHADDSTGSLRAIGAALLGLMH